MPESCVIWNAVRVALFIGILLNIINHRDAIFFGAEWPWGSMALNFIIPFLVSLYSGDKICRGESKEKVQ